MNITSQIRYIVTVPLIASSTLGQFARHKELPDDIIKEESRFRAF